jgi:spermidine/putrescine transport system substrate-binding protein
MMAGEKWDFFIPSMSWLQKAVRAGLMEPIDLSQIPNIKNLSDRGRQVMETELSHEGRVYGVPWTFVLNPIVWNTEKIPQKPETWATLWDEQYAGRITIKDEPLLAVMVASLYTGQDPYNIQDWGLIKSALMEQRKLVKKYWTSHDELGERLATEEVWLTQSNDGRARKLVRDGVPVSYTVPKEGAPATIDAMAIPKAATNKDAAHAFIDYCLRGNVMSEEIEIYDYMTLNPSAYENVDASYSGPMCCLQIGSLFGAGSFRKKRLSG